MKDDDDPGSAKDGGDFWQTAQESQKDAWIGWNFGVGTKVQIKEFLVDNNYTPRVFQKIALEGSNDGFEWIAIMNTGKINWTEHNQAKTFQVGDNWTKKPAYSMVRIFNCEFDPTGSHALIGKLKFVGSASTCSTKTTTSATTSITFTTAATATATATTTTDQMKVAGDKPAAISDAGGIVAEDLDLGSDGSDVSKDIGKGIVPGPGDEEDVGEPTERSNGGGVAAAAVITLLTIIGVLLGILFRRKRMQSAKATAAGVELQEDEDRRNTMQMEDNPHLAALKAKKKAAMSKAGSTVHNYAYVDVDTPDPLELPANVHVNLKENWFVGKMQKGDCKARVLAAKRGSFLVRSSKTTPGAYALCINLGDGRVQKDLAKPEVDAATGKAALLMPRIYFSKSKQSIQSFPDLQSLVQHCQQHPITPKHGCTLKLGRAARPLLLENAATSASASDALYSCTYGEIDSNLLDFYKKVVVGNHEIYDSSDTSNPLAPIEGTPSVSLKEAIKRAEAHCGVIPDDYVTAAAKCAAMHAKKATGKKPDQKRQDERNLEAIDIQSIFLYTIPCELYKKMNAALGKYGDEPDPRGNVVHYMPYIKLLTTSLTKLPKVRTIVYRGVKMPASVLLGGLKEGEIIKWWSFTSTTTNANALKTKEFLDADVQVNPQTKEIIDVRNTEYYSAGGGDVAEKTIFQIDVCSGVNVRPYSAIPQEDEILLMPGSRFRIRSIKKWRHGITEVRMEQLDVDGDGNGGGSTRWGEIELYMAVKPDVACYSELSAAKPVYSVGLQDASGSIAENDAEDNMYAYDSII